MDCIRVCKAAKKQTEENNGAQEIQNGPTKLGKIVPADVRRLGSAPRLGGLRISAC